MTDQGFEQSSPHGFGYISAHGFRGARFASIWSVSQLPTGINWRYDTGNDVSMIALDVGGDIWAVGKPNPTKPPGTSPNLWRLKPDGTLLSSFYIQPADLTPNATNSWLTSIWVGEGTRRYVCTTTTNTANGGFAVVSAINALGNVFWQTKIPTTQNGYLTGMAVVGTTLLVGFQFGSGNFVVQMNAADGSGVTHFPGAYTTYHLAFLSPYLYIDPPLPIGGFYGVNATTGGLLHRYNAVPCAFPSFQGASSVIFGTQDNKLKSAPIGASPAWSVNLTTIGDNSDYSNATGELYTCWYGAGNNTPQVGRFSAADGSTIWTTPGAYGFVKAGPAGIVYVGGNRVKG